MANSDKVRTLFDFQQNTAEHIAELKRTGQAEVLTVDGRAEIVVQDVSSYQAMLDELERAQALAGIRRGLAEADCGEGRPMREVLAELKNQADVVLRDKQ